MRTLGSAALVVILAMTASAAEIHIPAGMPLTNALLELQRRGLRLVFSSEIVSAEMTVQAEVRARDPRRALEQILAPHDLETAEDRGLIIIVRKARVDAKPAPQPQPRPVWFDEIVVQPSRISLLAEEPIAPVSLSREDIEALPHLGDDVFRTLRLLPGTASSDLSAELHLRGGRRDEMMIRLDGQELYDAFHLKEYDNALSIVPASALERAELMTGAFPVRYGDRMGGVLDMTTVHVTGRRLHLTGSIIGVQLEAGRSLRDGRARWFASLRRGNTDLLGRAFDLEGPAFADAFGKFETELTPRQSIALRLLASADELTFLASDKRLRTDYSSSYVWLTHRSSNGATLFVDSTASIARLDRDRRGFEDDEERTFDIRDERRLRVAGLAQSWSVQASPRHFIDAGFDLRRFDARYDFAGEMEFHTPLAAIRSEEHEGGFAASPRLVTEQLAIYASDRMRLADSLTIDAGLRLDDGVISPRLNAAWAVAPSTVLRAGWGRFLQRQRAHELMIEDGDVHFHPAERSTQWVVGIERLFESASVSGVRIEAYRRRVTNPRPRYENLLGPFDAFGEAEFDRVRVEPERASAEGLEVVMHGRPRERVDWFVNYTLARTSDRIDGVDVARAIDQRHALNVDVGRRLGNDWRVNLAWVYRTGHPTTAVFVEEGEPKLGPVNARRLPGYHRLDLRLSREWRRRSGTLTFFVDGHNLYSRRNVSGLDVKLDEETGELSIDRESWPRFFASAGISWELNGD